jgi:hypothetical protein
MIPSESEAMEAEPRLVLVPLLQGRDRLLPAAKSDR